MKQFRFLAAISVGMLVASCSSGGKHAVDDDTVVVTLSPGEDIQPDEFIDILDWTELKVDSSGTYIGEVKKLEIFNGNYYVLDCHTMNCVFKYDSNGRFVTRIGAAGEGPGEYPFIVDFTISKSEKEVAILSFPSAVYRYSLDGSFIAKSELTGKWVSLSANNAGLFTTSAYASLSESGNYLFSQFNQKGNPMGQWIEFDKVLQSPIPIFTNYMNSFGLSTYAVDNVNMRLFCYNVEENELKELMKLDFSR